MKKIIKHLKENWIRHGFETLVVTVGILGAFTLNNWNENRKVRTIEKQYLIQLVDELSRNLADVKELVNWESKVSLSSKIVVQALEDDLPYVDSLDKHFGRMVNPFKYNYNSSTYENLKSSGFNLITDSKLRIQIQDMYVELRELKEIMATLTQEYMLTLNVQQQHHLDVTQFNRPRDYESLKTNFVFINTVNDNGYMHGESSRLFEITAVNIEELLVVIKAEIASLEGQ